MGMYDGFEGIREDRYGVRAYVKVAQRQKEKRFTRGTKVKTITDWQDATRVALRAGRVQTPKDTLRNDAKRYLEHMRPRLVTSGYKSLCSEINAWVDAWGTIPRHKITRMMVLDLRQRWQTEPRGGTDARPGTRDARPLEPKTLNHRVRALRGLYHYIDGSSAPTPCDDVPKLPEPDPDPKFVSAARVRAVARTIADPKTRARFMVLASTGQRPAQLKRAQVEDVDLRRRVWFVRPAKRGKPIPVVLTDDMVVAFRVFIAAKAWGHFDGSDYAKRVYAAGWPRGVRPYNTKHTVAIALGESGAEWEDIKDWFGHRDVKSTRIYTGRILARTKATAKKLSGRIGWTRSAS